MKIVILGWGSLIWNPRELLHQEPWMKDGPELPLEFSRISKDCRLTLVIDALNGRICKSLYALSPRTSIADVVNDLMMQEGTSVKRIGYYDHRTKESSIEKFQEQIDIRVILSSWCKLHAFDGVVWTALLSNFTHELDKEFSVERAMTFLKNLPKTARKNALEYIQKAPKQIDTPLRKRVNREWTEV